jgi:hypothetical protein
VLFPVPLLSLCCVTASIGVPSLVGAKTWAPSPKYFRRLFFVSCFDFLALSYSLLLAFFAFGMTSIIFPLAGVPVMLLLFLTAFLNVVPSLAILLLPQPVF